jgi:2-phospho-L-lactate/phosphoenolpyruvate guanylyltransferase
MIYRALIPVKSLTQAKSRLANDLSREQRAKLVIDMLKHVVCVLQNVEMLSSIAVISPDQQVLRLANSWGINAYPEEVHGHNPALDAAARRELRTGASGLLTISADLPLLEANEIELMLDLAHRYQVVLGASHEGTGTNALLLRPPLAIPYLFGSGSLQSHEQAAKERGLSVICYNSTGTALDIDTIHDLEQLSRWQKKEKILQTMHPSC